MHTPPLITASIVKSTAIVTINLIKGNDGANLSLLYTLQGCSCIYGIVLTTGFQPSLEGCHHVSAENWAINGSSLKPGVFPSSLDTLLEGYNYKSSTFNQIVAQFMN